MCEKICNLCKTIRCKCGLHDWSLEGISSFYGVTTVVHGCNHCKKIKRVIYR